MTDQLPQTLGDGSVTDINVAPDAGIQASKIAFQPNGTGAVQLLISAILADRINVRSFGATGDAVTDDTLAFQAAANAATAQGKDLYIPAGWYILTNTVTINAPINIVGAGEATTVVQTKRFNGAAFEFAINTTVQSVYVGDFYLAASFQIGDIYTLSCAFLISGNATSFFQHARFRNLTIAGFYSAWKITKATSTTAFGQESPFAWSTFDNITLGPADRPMAIGWYFTLGSGTGHNWTNIKGDVTDAWLRFEGAGCVVGDVIFSNSHLGGSGGNTVVVALGAGTIYRENFAFPGNQYDAGMAYLLSVEGTGGVTPVNHRLVASNVGGGMDIYSGLAMPIRRSEISDRDVGQWNAGNYIDVPNGGYQTLNLFTIDLGTWTGSHVELTVSGAVSGVDAGVVSATYQVVRGAGNANVVQICSNTTVAAGGVPPASFFVLSAVASGSIVVFRTTFTPIFANSYIDAQIRCRGGTNRVKRG